jgi:hypothetical protein
MRSLRPISLFIILGITFLGTVGCQDLQRAVGLGNGSAADTEQGEGVGTQVLNATEEGQILTNEDAAVELTLPESWTEASQLHREAQLQAADPDNDLFILVLAERDESLLRFGLEENAERYRALLADRLASVESSTPTDVSFVGDNFASQHEIRGRLEDGTEVVYLHTTVVTEQGYYQVVGWTTPEQYSSYQSELETITDTFQEIDRA